MNINSTTEYKRTNVFHVACSGTSLNKWGGSSNMKLHREKYYLLTSCVYPITTQEVVIYTIHHGIISIINSNLIALICY